MVIRLVITMLQEQKDATIASATLATLNMMLRELPLLSMQDESPECIGAFQQWLLSVLTDTTERYSASLKQDTFGALLMLGLATGSLSTLLAALEVSEHTGMAVCASQLYVVPMLRKLDAWQIDLKLSVLSIESLCGSWTLLGYHVPILTSAAAATTTTTASGPAAGSSIASSSATITHQLSSILGASIATDGEYLYIHDSANLLKVGTGFFSEIEGCSTVRGVINRKVPSLDTHQPGWLACVGRKLYYRSSAIEPASLVVIDCRTLRVSVRGR
jgi:hypothetical protein